MAATKRKHDDDAASDKVLMEDLARVKVSRRSLVDILDMVRERGVPKHSSRSSFQRRRHDIAQTMTPYGPRLQHVNIDLVRGKPHTLYVQDPRAMLHYLAEHSDAFSRLLLRTRDAHPSMRWTLIMYNDEVTPTNPLKVGTDRRKVEAFYWSFAEFGPSLLCNDKLWFVLCVARSTAIHKADGGMTNVARTLLRKCFCRRPHFFLTAGVTLTLKSNEPMHLLASLGVLVGDLPALKQLLSWKGYAGAKPCCVCRNVVSKARAAMGVCYTSTDFANMRPYTDESVRSTYATIVTAQANGEAIAELETDLGWNFSSRPLIMETDMLKGVISCVMFDWMHIYMVNGIVVVEVGSLMKTLASTRKHLRMKPITYAHIDAYLQRWCWPRGHASPQKLCAPKDAKSWESNREIGGTASELLSFLPVFARFVDAVVAETDLGKACATAIKSLLACSAVVERLHAIMRGIQIDHEELYQHIAEHLTAFVAAYGEENMKNKHHFAVHLPQIYKQHGYLIACWVHERRHQIIRKHTSERKTLVGYERSVSEEVCADTCNDMLDLDLWLDGGLADGHSPSKKMKAALANFGFELTDNLQTGSVLHTNGYFIYKRDLAIVNCSRLEAWEYGVAEHACSGFAQVWGHVRRTGTMHSIVSPWVVAECNGAHVVLRTRDDPIIVPSCILNAPLIHMRTMHSSALALLPYEYRRPENHTEAMPAKAYCTRTLPAKACTKAVLRCLRRQF